MAIRLFRIFTGDDQSHFSVGEIEWNTRIRIDAWRDASLTPLHLPYVLRGERFAML
jgi:hypothetical protein